MNFKKEKKEEKKQYRSTQADKERTEQGNSDEHCVKKKVNKRVRKEYWLKEAQEERNKGRDEH